ncbi:hypothetical protein HPB48_026855 [Haemaphysalis longicornis]|uniref:DUF5641 domain-containing protein n=1 Tax=Haemaphysalis longicornis TaxID=44386 RepID=A0A9J6HCW7_HAELO|nr:hypothetical protein HPB48_026855 [Haemaphysalis longicornis]
MAHLWRRWRREYLLLLRSAHGAASPPGPEVQIGDVVVIQDDASSPMLWKLGRVLETFAGRDGVVRSCRLRVSSGQEIRRPVQRLYILEANPPRPP